MNDWRYNLSTVVGSSISHYKIIDKLGQGGMGVVYRAEDTKLDRPVALKFLPAHLLGDEDIRKRFEREAKAAAALDHPNVCHVYEIDEADGKTFIAMSLIEGESLDKRIALGPLKLEDALDIAQQTAKGLEAAHKRGVVHRDIKPENIMVGEDGRVTIMDFGLAQLTEVSRLTRTDETVGTTAYMSPEQTQGSGTDHRTDIWSLGVVLYEMVTGQQPFKGDYDKAVMYSILNESPEPITALRTGVPMELELLVNKCLAKEGTHRYQHADELATDLASLTEKLKPDRSKVAATVMPTVPTPSRAYLPWAVAAVLALTLVVTLLRAPEQPAPPPQTRRLALDIPATARVAISPDSRYIAYDSAGGNVAREIWVADLQRNERRLLAQGSVSQPFWSADSRNLGYLSGTDLVRVSVEGGSPIRLCDAPLTLSSPAWSSDDKSVVFTESGLVFEVSALGGEPREIPGPCNEEQFRCSHVAFLPLDSGRRVVTYGLRHNDGSPTELVVHDLDSDELWAIGSADGAVYSPTGHLLYRAAGLGINALPFSLDSLQAVGEAFSLGMDTDSLPSVSARGELVYVRRAATKKTKLVWHDRNGGVISVAARSDQEERFVDLWPDEGVALTWSRSNVVRAWDLERGVSTDLTSPEQWYYFPVLGSWGALYGGAGLWARPIDLSAEQFKVIDSPWAFPYDISADGRHIVYGVRLDGETDFNMWRIERDEQGRFSDPVPYYVASTPDVDAQISPDNKYAAYASRQSNRWEIMVQPFPKGGPQTKITPSGGMQVRWNPRGGELFYANEGTLFAVDVATDPALRVGRPRRLFNHEALAGSVARQSYAVSSDGERFLLTETDEDTDSARDSVVLVENWYEEFRDRD